LQALDVRVFDGPNVHSRRPVVQLRVDLSPYDDVASTDLEGFVDRLLSTLPGLSSHRCSEGHPGGFVERLRDGTYLGHVVEHVALELQAAAGMGEVAYGKTRWTGERGIYTVAFEYVSASAGERAAERAVEIVEALAAGGSCDVKKVVAELRGLAASEEPGPSTRALLDAARERGIPVMRLEGDWSLYQLGYGSRSRRIKATLTDETGCIAADIAGDKVLTKSLLKVSGIPVPAGGVAARKEDALAIAKRLGPPVAVKPYSGNHGRGVSLGLRAEAEIKAAFDLALNHDSRAIVEKYIEGRHYRVLVVGGGVAAASERIPAHVVGDGRRTLRELIEEANEDPRRGEGHERPLTVIRIDPVVLMYLARQNLTLNYVPRADEVVYLRQNANLSTGGTAADVTDDVHPDNAELAVRAAMAVGLDVAGIDLVTPDISRPVARDGGAVIEVNAAPGIRMHLYPSAGAPRPVGRRIVDHLFPPGRPARVPIVAVTGTNGKTTTARMIAKGLEAAGKNVGLATTDGVYIGGRAVSSGDSAGPDSARMLLRDTTVEACVLETARGGVIRGGLGFDACDVAVLLNVSEDHLGQDGLESIDDVLYVKAVVAEAVRDGGYLVLNADDPRVVRLAERSRGTPVPFSTTADNVLVKKNVARGDLAAYADGRRIVLVRGGREELSLPLRDVPCTWGGRITLNVENALAAAAALLALGVPARATARALSQFQSDSATNPGRFNVFDLDGLVVVLDYGHNPSAFEAAAAAARALGSRRLVGVVGVPGDRRDQTVVNAGRAAGRCFDAIVLKEDQDRRGREPGAVASLLRQGALQEGMAEEDVEVVLDEAEAARRALDMAGEGDVVLVFYEKYERAMNLLRRMAQDRGADLVPRRHAGPGSPRGDERKEGGEVG